MPIFIFFKTQAKHFMSILYSSIAMFPIKLTYPVYYVYPGGNKFVNFLLAAITFEHFRRDFFSISSAIFIALFFSFFADFNRDLF
jgi:predicted 2-oxoglutarate/Fe(II)-dependent dioxygenase YbiX